MTPDPRVERRAEEIREEWPRGVRTSWLSIGREATVVGLAFMAGAGGYFASLKEPPRMPEDYLGAIGAGALLALAKMIPTNTGGGSRG